MSNFHPGQIVRITNLLGRTNQKHVGSVVELEKLYGTGSWAITTDGQPWYVFEDEIEGIDYD